ncbi:hypothetical protein DFH04_07390 [Clostridium novyi]|uniref:hypothetical protein n=1 Tax=Clostridium novyi TaxID=1542 RepID=UPI000EA0E8CC|nr:hypothetical protein [Clostridium novyi]AYF54540.1 hypothetical protein DFH04_07390 [Clostridium novyi]
MSNKGTLEGTAAEIDFVIQSNKDKTLNNPTWTLLSNKLNLDSNLTNYHVIRVTSKVFSRLNNKKVLPKADAYLVEGVVPNDYLIESNYFLNESDVSKFNLKQISYSGISIKRPDSKKFQILKITPDSFKELIGNYVLGAGASIYCKKAEELIKNDFVLKGWHTTWKELTDYFSFIENVHLVNTNKLSNIEMLSIFKEIKNISNERIKKILLNDTTKLDIAFKGTGIFDEPYPAYFLFKDNMFTLNKPFDFKVTTGSGRSKGDFTIVLKP